MKHGPPLTSARKLKRREGFDKMFSEHWRCHDKHWTVKQLVRLQIPSWYNEVTDTQRRKPITCKLHTNELKNSFSNPASEHNVSLQARCIQSGDNDEGLSRTSCHLDTIGPTYLLIRTPWHPAEVLPKFANCNPDLCTLSSFVMITPLSSCVNMIAGVPKQMLQVPFTLHQGGIRFFTTRLLDERYRRTTEKRQNLLHGAWSITGLQPLTKFNCSYLISHPYECSICCKLQSWPLSSSFNWLNPAIPPRRITFLRFLNMTSEKETQVTRSSRQSTGIDDHAFWPHMLTEECRVGQRGGWLKRLEVGWRGGEVEEGRGWLKRDQVEEGEVGWRGVGWGGGRLAEEEVVGWKRGLTEVESWMNRGIKL